MLGGLVSGIIAVYSSALLLWCLGIAFGTTGLIASVFGGAVFVIVSLLPRRRSSSAESETGSCPRIL